MVDWGFTRRLEKGIERFAEANADTGRTLERYCVGIVNPGENFVSFEDGRWIDWSEEVNKLKGLEKYDFIAYDNLPIKGYAYPLSEVEEIHNLSKKVKTVNGETANRPFRNYHFLIHFAHSIFGLLPGKTFKDQLID